MHAFDWIRRIRRVRRVRSTEGRSQHNDGRNGQFESDPIPHARSMPDPACALFARNYAARPFSEGRKLSVQGTQRPIPDRHRSLYCSHRNTTIRYSTAVVEHRAATLAFDSDPRQSSATDAAKLHEYWRFYWPLMLTGLAMVLAVQFQNATLARFPDAVKELAIFAIAHSTFMLFGATLNFTGQLSNLFARSVHGSRTTNRFLTAAAALAMLGVGTLAGTTPGQALLANLYELDDDLLSRVCTYMLLLAPSLPITAQRFFVNGQLVQARLTGWVTVLNTLFLASMIGFLLVGYVLGWGATYTLCGAQFAAGLVHWFAGLIVRHWHYELPQQREHEQLSYGELIRFYLPVTWTGVMFAISRPVLYAFVARTPDALVSIAALRIGFDFSMLFQQAANQFRSFWVTYGLGDMAVKRQFMRRMAIGITGTMLLLSVTPANDWILITLLGSEPEVLRPALEVILIMCALPVLIVWRNYYHGILMVRQRTNGMALGGVLRVGGIALLAQSLSFLGWLDHRSAALVLLCGFLIEALTVAMTVRSIEQQDPEGPPVNA